MGIDWVTWHARGNLASDGTFDYSHDYLNRLCSVGSLTMGANYDYDSFNRRTSKLVNNVMTTFFYDQDRCILEYDGTGTITRKFVYGPGIDEPILMETGGQKYYYHSNALGTVVALSDQSGEIAESYRYTPFGQVQDAGSLGNPYLFTGRRYDAETGLYYYRARFYHPELRRFIEPDPIGYYDGLNLYAYVLNNPVMRVDPEGLWTAGIDISGFAGAGVGGTEGIILVFDSEGNWGVIQHRGRGLVFGMAWSFAVQFQFTDASSIDNLVGPSLTIGGSVGQRAQVSYEDITMGGYSGYNVGVGTGVGTPAEGHAIVEISRFVFKDDLSGAIDNISDVLNELGDALADEQDASSI